MGNLIAHLVRRVLMPSAIRPRAPSRFEPPGTAAAAADIALEPQWTPAGGEARGRASAPAEPAPVVIRAPVAEVADAAPTQPRAEEPGLPVRARSEPGREHGHKASRPPPVATRVLVRAAADDRTETRANTAITTQLPPPVRKTLRPQPQTPRQPATVVQERELHTRVRERLNFRSERLVTPLQPAVPPPVRPTVTKIAAPQTAVESRAAVPAVEIHIGRIDVRPLSPPALPPEQTGSNLPRAKPQSLEDYLSSRSRERGGQR